MKRRLFAALPVKSMLVPSLQKLQKVNPDLEIRWTRSENLHVTVIFLGYVELRDLPEILKVLKKIAEQTEPIEFQLEKVIPAPPKQTPRMLWVVLSKEKGFTKLSKRLGRRLGRFARDEFVKREPVPHITLARFTDKKQAENFQQVKMNKLNFLTDQLVLFESRPTKLGSNYFEIETFKLKKVI